MAENNQNNTSKEDPEEVAARQAGKEVTLEVEEADKKVVRENEKAEKEASKDEDGKKVDPSVHVPHVVTARKR